jgi:oxygen-dependent protoporphyrinogen oxidase
MSNRRDFLKTVAAAGGWFAFKGLGAATPLFAATKKKFPPGVWGGNMPTWCHDLVRDGGKIPQVSPSRRVDVCVVGGGLAGLSAAYKLRDTNVLVLEHLDRIGGHAVRDRWSDIWYSGAAAYFVEPEEPLSTLYSDLKLPLKEIAEPSDSAILSWNRILDTMGSGIDKLPYPAAAKKDFARFKRDMMAIYDGDDLPLMPLSETSDGSRQYDRTNFADWLLEEKKYHPAVKSFVDLYARSAFGAPSCREVSTFAFLNFYTSEFYPRYTFPGGNALAAERLRDEIDAAGENRVLSNATAVRVEPQGDKVIVTHVDKGGRFSAVEARVVIMANPKYIAKYLVAGIPKDQEAAMSGLNYGSYVVANVLCTSAITDNSYDTWVDTAPFTDFIVADWIARGPDKKATKPQQVLTVYYPVAYDKGMLLPDNGYDFYRDAVVEHLGLFFPGAESKIEDVRLYRWGHALCHGAPGWYTQKSELAKRPVGKVLFAHSDNQGLPAFESALPEGLAAAEEARKMLGRVTLEGRASASAVA